MKIVISESKIKKIARSFLEDRIGIYESASGRGYPGFIGAFFHEDENTPTCYVLNDTLNINRSIVETTIDMFNIDIKTIKELLIEIVNGFIDPHKITNVIYM
jgi:hypothetical protein